MCKPVKFNAGTDFFCSKCDTFVKQVDCPNPEGLEPHKLLHGPKLTVDGIIELEGPRFVLIERKQDPGKGKLALPGGFVNFKEQCIPAVAREVEEETGLVISLDAWELVGVYDHPARDGDEIRNTVSLVYAEKCTEEPPQQPNDDDSEIQRIVILSQDDINADPSAFAFDHWEVLDDYINGRRSGFRWQA